MSSNEIDNLNETIAQALQQMKAELGDKFSLKKVNLAELSRRTGISRKRLRNAKKHGFRIPVHGNTGRKKDNTVLTGYTAIIDILLRKGVTNSNVILEHLQENGYCKKLFFTTAIPEMCQAEGTPKQIEYLRDALKKEIDKRDANHIQRLIKRARFPVYKTFDGYEFKFVRMPPVFSKEELMDVSFIEKKQNLVLYGPVGVGKTHMAIAAGIIACRKRYKARFYIVTELVLKLAEARKTGTLERLRNTRNQQDLLILDEWCYVPVDRDGSELLFQVISDSYESKSLILTTNLEFSRWGSIFTDEQMAAAMIDRLVHHGHLILFEGQSYRMEHALMRQTAPQPEQAVF